MSFEVLFTLWLTLPIISTGAGFLVVGRFREKKWLWPLSTFVVVCSLAMFAAGYLEFFTYSPQITEIKGVEYSLSNRNKGIWPDLASEIVVSFDRPVQPADLKLELGPELQGEWAIRTGGGFWGELFSFKRQAVFTPARTAYPGSELQLYIVGLRALAQSDDAGDKLFEITALGIETNSLRLEQVAGGASVQFPARLAGSYELDLLVRDSLDRIIPVVSNRQDDQVLFKIEDRINAQGQMQRYKAELFLSQVTRNPQTGLIVSRKERELVSSLEFEQVAQSTIDFSKQLIWQNPADRTIFKQIPGSLEFVFGSLLNLDGELLEQKVILEPRASWRVIKRGQLLELQFLEALKFDTEYTVVLLPGIVGAGVAETETTSQGGTQGNTQSSSQAVTFRTPKERFQLSVPLIRQDLQFECNLTAASMLLAFYGFDVSKEQIYQGIPKDNTPYDVASGIWGDPDLGFVGDISGRTKGYGVHWQPVIDYLSNYRQMELRRNWNIAELLQTVKSGKPVMLWWQNGRSAKDKMIWQTPAGRTIEVMNGMHSEVVVGFEGGQESPEFILVNDPWRGFRRVPIAEFNELWKIYSNTAIF